MPGNSVFVTFLGSRDPFKGWNRDLQCLGIKKYTAAESPGDHPLRIRFVCPNGFPEAILLNRNGILGPSSLL